MSVVRVFGTNGLGDSDSVAKFAGNREKNREFYLLPKGAAPNYHALTVVYPDIGRQGAGNCRVRCREDIRLGAPIQAKLASRFVLAFDLLNKIKAAPDFESDPISSKPNRLLAILEDEGHTGTARPPLGVSHDFQEVLSSVAVALRRGVDELLYESSPLCHSFATTLHPFLHFTIDILVQILPNVRAALRTPAGITGLAPSVLILTAVAACSQPCTPGADLPGHHRGIFRHRQESRPISQA